MPNFIPAHAVSIRATLGRELVLRYSVPTYIKCLAFQVGGATSPHSSLTECSVFLGLPFPSLLSRPMLAALSGMVPSTTLLRPATSTNVRGIRRFLSLANSLLIRDIVGSWGNQVGTYQWVRGRILPFRSIWLTCRVSIPVHPRQHVDFALPECRSRVQEPCSDQRVARLEAHH